MKIDELKAIADIGAHCKKMGWEMHVRCEPNAGGGNTIAEINIRAKVCGNCARWVGAIEEKKSLCFFVGRMVARDYFCGGPHYLPKDTVIANSGEG